MAKIAKMLKGAAQGQSRACRPANQSEGAVKHFREVEITRKNSKYTEIELNRRSVKIHATLKYGTLSKTQDFMRNDRFYYSNKTVTHGMKYGQ